MPIKDSRFRYPFLTKERVLEYCRSLIAADQQTDNNKTKEFFDKTLELYKLLDTLVVDKAEALKPYEYLKAEG